MKKITLTPSNVKHLGRTLMPKDTLHLIMSATGCAFSFTGKKLTVNFGCDEYVFNSGNECALPRIAVTINDRPVIKKIVCRLREDYTIIDEAEPITAEIKIIKLSEAVHSILNIFPLTADDEANVSPAEKKSLRIEFIGDSITCGYGVDDSNENHSFSTASENAMKSCAYLTAELLDADYSMFSASGYGIISGYSDNGQRVPEKLIPPFYDSFGFSFASVPDLMPQNIPWDFSRFVPDIIVINLGTNDDSFTQDNTALKQEFEDSYLDFLKKVRLRNPNAEIFCILGIMSTRLYPQVENACKRLCDSGVHPAEFKCQDGLLGFSANWHPSEDTHLLAAEKLAELIRLTRRDS